MAWYATSGWTKRKKLIIDHTLVAADLTDYPVLVSMTDTDLRDNAQADGDDILFTASDGTTKLSHELEKYTTASGLIIAWVKSNVSSSTDTEIYMYYGNSGATAQADPTNAWDSGYLGVWHMGTATTLSLLDSTANNLDFTNNAISADTGVIDGAGSSQSNTGVAGCTVDASLAYGSGDIITVEAIVKRSNGAKAYRPILALSKVGSGTYRNFEFCFNGQAVGEITANSITYVYRIVASATFHSYSHNAADDDTTAFHHYACTFTIGTAASIKLYKDGQVVAGTWKNNGDTLPTENIDKLYLFSTDNAAEYLYGLGDEIRLSKGVARSAEWVETQYNNLSAPATFMSADEEETEATGSSSSSVSASPSSSPSLSPSSSPSLSPSLSPSSSPSSSPSTGSSSPSSSASLSPSVSPSSSPSASPSPGYEYYTRGDYVTLPANDTNLETAYSAQDYLDVDTKNDVRVLQSATSQFAIHQFKDVADGSSCHLECECQTNCPPSLSTVYLQIYNRNTTSWDTVDSDNTSAINTDFTLTADIADLTNYKDGSSVVSCRVHQEDI